MAKKKYYAVKAGKVPGVYQTWDECKAQVDGFSGAKYKSFTSLAEAEQFVSAAAQPAVQSEMEAKDRTVSSDDINKMVEDRIKALKEDETLAFVDGSFSKETEKAGFGVILISHGGNRDTLYKAITKKLDEDFIKLRNVAAELEGVKEAISWAIKYNKKKITIFYDYAGIEAWAAGDWRAKTSITQNYVSFIETRRKYIKMEFIKVPAHAGILYNEEADALAKSSLLAKGYKTYNDGSVYIIGLGVEDWRAVAEHIQHENADLADEETVSTEVTVSVEMIGQRERIIIAQQDSWVRINCYSDIRSYVQGPESVLYQKVIALAVEMQSNGKSVIETLNTQHVLNMEQYEVESQFEMLLPDYRGSRSDKHFANLLSAVYNTMTTGYMPDYTCLLSPVFRAYEYYLHKILGDKMGLTTAVGKGKNNFKYFSKHKSGKYTCNNSNIEKLTEVQRNLLNELYTEYCSVRHVYSHWSVDNEAAAVISDIETARKLLLRGLSLVNEYYVAF